jgi:hypothetical protein
MARAIQQVAEGAETKAGPHFRVAQKFPKYPVLCGPYLGRISTNDPVSAPTRRLWNQSGTDSLPQGWRNGWRAAPKIIANGILTT